MGGSPDKAHRKIHNFSFSKGLIVKNFQPIFVIKEAFDSYISFSPYT
jgi:hypothetical protein